MVDATRDGIRKRGKIKMKFLNQYLKFQWEPFAEGKRFMCIGIRKWEQNENVMGTLVDTVIVQDKTNYGKEGSNIYEKLTFKVPHVVEIPANVEVIPHNVEAKVWGHGEFKNQLSCKADSIEVITK